MDSISISYSKLLDHFQKLRIILPYGVFSNCSLSWPLCQQCNFLIFFHVCFHVFNLARRYGLKQPFWVTSCTFILLSHIISEVGKITTFQYIPTLSIINFSPSCWMTTGSHSNLYFLDISTSSTCNHVPRLWIAFKALWTQHWICLADFFSHGTIMQWQIAIILYVIVFHFAISCYIITASTATFLRPSLFESNSLNL